MSTFVVEDVMCWVGESQHRNHQGESFHPANAGIEPPLSSPGLRNGALEWSNYCSVCELRLKSQQRWSLVLAQGFALLTQVAQFRPCCAALLMVTLAQLMGVMWEDVPWWREQEPAGRTSVSRAPPGLCLKPLNQQVWARALDRPREKVRLYPSL